MLTTQPFLAGVVSFASAINDMLREATDSARHGGTPSLRLPVEVDAAWSSQNRAFGLIVVASVVGLLFVAAARTAGFTGLIATWRPRLRLPPGRVRRWIDLSSPYDPVSCGPLLRGVADETVRTINSAIPGREHGSYRKHPLVLTMVASRLAQLSWGSAAVPPSMEQHVRTYMSSIEQRRLHALRAVSACTTAATLLIIAGWTRHIGPWLDQVSQGVQTYL